MTNEDLFLALSGVNPEYLEHSEGCAPVRKRTLRRIVLLAAAAAALAGTVIAAPYVRAHLQKLWTRQSNQAAVVEDFYGNVNVYQGWMDVNLTLDLEEDRPQYIETFYVPLYFAENWQTPETKSVQSQDTPINSSLTWYTEDGTYAIVDQYIVDSRVQADGEEYPFDSIQVGYDAEVRTETVQLGGREVFRVIVGSSSLESEGEFYTAEGYQKYYWSDGLYLFTLETSLSVSEETVALALESIAPVDDISAHRNIRDSENEETQSTVPELTRAPLQETVWYPAYLPEGWEQVWGCTNLDGFYAFAWERDLENTAIRAHLELEQFESGSLSGYVREWETDVGGFTKEVRTIGGWEVTIYSKDTKIEAFWITENCDYSLCFRGPDGMTVEEIVQIIENLQIAEDPQSLLTE